jgi:hypothetical protein
MDLKEKLLILNIFQNNEYFNNYIDLILKNKYKEKTKYTQRHHIIPKCYFKINKLVVDDNIDNLVNLDYTDHILAHYYLCLCTTDKIKGKLCNAFFHLVNCKYNCFNFCPARDLAQFQTLYEYYVEHKREICGAVNEVMCVETGQIFKNTSFANDFLKINRYDVSVYLACEGVQHTAHGYH